MGNDLSWSVYVHTNKTNGKRYIGITSAPPKKRWGNGVRYKTCRYFYFAIQKYGWDGFEHDVIVSGVSKPFAEYMERALISRFKTTDSEYGYNIQDGGISNGGLSEEGLRSIRECNTGINAKNRKPVVVFDLSGNKVAEFCCIREAESFLGVVSLHDHIYSRHGTRAGHIVRLKSDVGDSERLSPSELSDAVSTKFSDGRPSAHSRSITVFDSSTGEKVGNFKSIKTASLQFNLDFASALYRRNGVTGGFVAIYSDQCVGKDKLSASDLKELSKSPFSKEVFQFSMDGFLIQKYSSLKEASDKTKTSYKTLSQCLSGHCQSAGGYLWSFSAQHIPQKPKTAWESRIENHAKTGTPVDQVDLKTGKVVATYRSIGEAAKAANTYKTSISDVINHRGNHVSAGGFGWKYHEPGRG